MDFELGFRVREESSMYKYEIEKRLRLENFPSCNDPVFLCLIACTALFFGQGASEGAPNPE